MAEQRNDTPSKPDGAAPQQVIVLTANGLATKRHTRLEDGTWHTEGYSAGTFFMWREEPVEDIFSLAAVIENLDEHEFPIRGGIHDDKRSEPIHYRRLVNFGGSRGATPCQSAMLDIDDISIPDHFDIYVEPEAAIEWVISEHLPACFHDVTCFWQLSSSAGIKTGFSAHIWFWFDRPVTGGDLGDFLAVEAPAIDLVNIRNDVQPQYCATPIFVGGPDPIPNRQAIMEREQDFATLPVFDVPKLQERAKAAGVGWVAVDGPGDFESHLSRMGDGDGLAGFHEPITRAIYAAVTAARLQSVNDEALKARIREVVRAAPKRPGRDVSVHTSDDYLDKSIRGAIRRRAEQFIEATAPIAGVAPLSLRDGGAALSKAVGAFFTAAEDARVSKAAYETKSRELVAASSVIAARTESNYREYRETGVMPTDYAQGSSLGQQPMPVFLNETPTPEEAHRAIPVHAISAEMGLGKSRETLAAIAKQVEAGLRVHHYIQIHRLGEEVVEKFAEFSDIPARSWQGRGREELNAEGRVMCFEEMQPKAALYEKAKVSVAKYLCPTCPHSGECGWSRQREDKAFGLVIMPIQYAFEDTAERANLQVFDESFWQASITGSKVSLAALMEATPRVPKRKGRDNDDNAQADLAAARSKLKAALAVAEGNVPTIEQLKACGIDNRVIAFAMAAEYQRAESVARNLIPSQSLEEMAEVIEQYKNDGYRWAAIWRSLDKQFNLGRDRLYGWRIFNEDVGGETIPRLKVTTSRDLKAPDIPTLVLDGTLDETITRRFLPGLSEITHIAVEPDPSAVQVIQVYDSAVAKNKIAPNPPKEEDTKKELAARDGQEELQRKQNNATKLGQLAEVIAAWHTSVGLITYKQTEEFIAPSLPSNVIVDHFNNTRGRNTWEDVDVMITAGRTLPSEDAVELLAEAIHYCSKTEIQRGKYGITRRRYHLRNGFQETEGVAHPDPLVEAVRYQICEAEVIQNIARPRGIRRTPDRPLINIIVTNVPLPVRVDTLVTWDDLMPSKALVAQNRAVSFESPQDAALAYPDLFKDKKAAENAGAGGLNTVGGAGLRLADTYSPIYNSIIGEKVSALPSVTYKKIGKGQRRRRASFDPARVPDIKAWLTERLGPLKTCLVTYSTTPEAEEVAEQPETLQRTASEILLGCAPGLLAAHKINAVAAWYGKGKSLDRWEPPPTFDA